MKHALVSCTQVIRKDFDGVFKRLTFAILEDDNSLRRGNPKGNCAPFATELDCKVTKLDEM